MAREPAAEGATYKRKEWYHAISAPGAIGGGDARAPRRSGGDVGGNGGENGVTPFVIWVRRQKTCSPTLDHEILYFGPRLLNRAPARVHGPLSLSSEKNTSNARHSVGPATINLSSTSSRADVNVNVNVPGCVSKCKIPVRGRSPHVSDSAAPLPAPPSAAYDAEQMRSLADEVLK